MAKETCICCGCVIDTDTDAYFETAYGNIICQDCRDNEYAECYECGGLYRADDMYTTINDELVCEHCKDDYYVWCEDCGDLVYTDDAIYVENYGYYCGDCADHNFYYCDECGEYVGYDDYNFNTNMCVDCASRKYRDVILPYHYRKGEPPKFFKSVLERAGIHEEPKWYIGPEWEWETDENEYEIAKELTEILGERAYNERDCTVDVETVFQPHSYDAIIESGEIKKAFDYAKEHMREESPNAGLHIHISRTAFGETQEEQDENIAKLIVLHTEGHAFEMLKKLSRRTTCEWCSGFRKCSDRERAIDDAKEYVKLRWNDHNVAINCGNSQTVEFRLGAGTVDYDNFIAWVKIIKLIVDNCKSIDIEKASNFYLWLKGADDSVKAYMEKMGVPYEEPIEVTDKDYDFLLKTLMDKINADLSMNGANTMDYNTMLTVLCNAPTQLRMSLGYM